MAFRSRFRNFRARSYSRARTFYKKYGGARGIAGVSMPWLAGGVAGYMAPRVHPLQDVIITALAIAPVRLPRYVGPVCKGYVAGMLVKNFLPSIGGISSASGGGDFV